ncbi:uncharacterized protein SCODWIG_00045 [Saccharomycodes ludwigii]|uniref:Bud site selection protein RAX2 n=1 Tax=Saccharomycodes ludwigii TaxID=36035 RepID=A0A376B1C5_9ASCO|nr:hypothetical protein SCDLUD_001691 [Saccharomycodes ludwigii]KAH3901907.1 hypothetical protein SCDLUD_001691 [Saccharomycodes ludwigii]SSD58284.1 uncharacterized protein SCODWIG_00045 [Saccharomycodes ludwigii]
MLRSCCLYFFVLIHLLLFSKADTLTESLIDHFNATSVDLPSINFSSYKNNEFNIFGLTDSSPLLLYKYFGQENFTSKSLFAGNELIYFNNNPTNLYDNTTTKYIKINQLTNHNNIPSTMIDHITYFKEDSFILSGYGYLSATNGDASYNLAKQLFLNLTSLQYFEIFDQELSSVNSILVDSNIVYFGGDFSFNNESHSIAIWNYTSNSTSSLPYVRGFGSNSTINSILKLNNDSILFAGRFNTLDNFTYLEIPEYYTNTTLNTTTYMSENYTNGNDSSINDQQVSQLIPLIYSTWNTDNGGNSQLSNEQSFICPNVQNTDVDDQDNWIGYDSSSSFFSINFLNAEQPSKMRIFNSQLNPVTLFRVLSLPTSGIMNLTYLDPLTNTIKSCDAFCPLYHNITTEQQQNVYINDNTTSLSYSPFYQDFAFVNEVEMEGLEFLSLSGVNTEVGLAGFQLFERLFFTYANNTLNDPECNSAGNYSSASISTTTDWYRGYDGESYIASKFESNINNITDNTPFVKFNPLINYNGNYTINLYTPGCTQDSTCSQRSIVNVTIYYQDDENSSTDELKSQSKIIYQNNDNDKYDNIYTGYLYSAPVIKMVYFDTVLPENTISIMVADRLSVYPNEIPDPYSSTTTITRNYTESYSVNKTIELNGLFQYQPSNFTNSNLNTSQKIGNTSLNRYIIDVFGTNDLLNLYAVPSVNDSVFLASSTLDGIIKLQLDNQTNEIMQDSKLNSGGSVSSVGVFDNDIDIFFGNFNVSNQELSMLYYNQTFNSFGKLPDNQTIRTFQNITFSNGTTYLVFNNKYFFNLNTRSYVLNNSDFQTSVWSADSNSNGDTLFYGGLFDISGFSSVATNQPISITDNLSTIGTFGIPASNGNVNEVYAAVYINESLTGYAIESKANDSLFNYVTLFDSVHNQTRDLTSRTFKNKISNMAFVDNKLLSVGTEGTEFTIFNLSSTNNTISTIAMDLNSTLDTSSIQSVLYFSKNNTYLVGGEFKIGDCNGLCLLNMNTRSWSTFLNNSISGEISKMQFSNITGLLYIAGNFTKNNNGTFSNTSDVQSVQFANVNLTSSQINLLRYNDDDHLVNDFVIASDSTDTNYDSVTVISDNYIYQYSNGSWSDILNDNSFNLNSTTFTSIQLLSKAGSNISSKKKRNTGDIISSNTDNTLLVVGHLNHSSYGIFGAMLYSDGNWIPYLQTVDFSTNSDDKISPVLFMNQDISKFLSSEIPLKSSNTTNITHATTTTSSFYSTSTIMTTIMTSSSTPTSTTPQIPTGIKKIDRGFIVLIGLALSIGTVALLGLIGLLVMLWYTEKNKTRRLTPRINEDEMLKTVPPEKLMRYI